MEIHIKVIPHKEQRYETCGDWWWEGERLEVRVSDMKNWKYEMLVALHEVVETLICKDRGIREEDVTNFDVEFEKNRAPGNEDEPGDDPKAPYKQAHFIATNIERQLADILNVDWGTYDSSVSEL